MTKRNGGNPRPWEYPEDCIHLHACRRMRVIYKSWKSRGCTEECSAYQTANEVVKGAEIVEDIIDAAVKAAVNLINDCACGYSPDDLCVESKGYMREAIMGVFDE